MSTPVATYRDSNGRLRLLVDAGREAGVYAGRVDGRTFIDACDWIAMRSDVALSLVRLGRCGFGPQAAATLRHFVLNMDHPRAIDRNWPVWRRLPVGVAP